MNQFGTFLDGIRFPTRVEYVDIIRGAAKGTRLRPSIKRKLTIYAKQARRVVYGRDSWACASCPLRAIGVERNGAGAWQEDGAHDFMVRYDKAMYDLVKLRPPVMIGVAREDKARRAM